MHGVLNLLKPPGMTSHDAVAFVRRVLKNKRVGHTGTLDPAAAGVLPICVGQATRLVEYLQAGTKAYEAEATFGFETDTLDQVGTIVRECDASHLDLQTLRVAMEPFRGSIVQTPPMHSAIKVGGQKLYDLARAGEEIEIPTRTVEISSLRVARFEPSERPRAWIQMECSGGTYVRSLVRDIGQAVGLAATMTFLVRTHSGHFALEDAVSVEEFAASPILTPLEEVLGWLVASSHFDDEATHALWQGKKIAASRLKGVLSERVEREEEHALRERRVVSFENLRGEGARPVLFTNREKSILALAVPCEDEPDRYRAEKVFDLR